jgi:hypothetical protein
MITRRIFFQTLGIASVAGTLLNLNGPTFGQKSDSNGLFQIPAESLSDPVLSFKSEHFTPFINTDFEIRHENMRRVERLTLLNVKQVERKANVAEGVQGDSFSLMFTSPREAKIKAGQYEFTHFSLGTFKLTISPVSAEPNRYEAVINHLQR